MVQNGLSALFSRAVACVFLCLSSVCVCVVCGLPMVSEDSLETAVLFKECRAVVKWRGFGNTFLCACWIHVTLISQGG